MIVSHAMYKIDFYIYLLILLDFRDAMWSTQVKKKDEREINQERKNFLVDLNVNYAGCITFTRRLISLFSPLSSMLTFVLFMLHRIERS